jgi:hypothetical protein
VTNLSKKLLQSAITGKQPSNGKRKIQRILQTKAIGHAKRKRRMIPVKHNETSTG